MAIILYAVASEKAVGAIERANTLTLMVDGKATSKQVKEEVERQFGQKVTKVNTLVTNDGKKAYVRFQKAGAASDVASKLKIL